MAYQVRSEEIERLYQKLSTSMDVVYAYISMYNDLMLRPRDYGTGLMISMVEIHTLTMIADNPGITINELARMWRRTKGAISQNVTKLEQKGLISRKRCTEDARVVHLYVTEDGSDLVSLHKDYDYRENIQMLTALRQTCTEEEVEHFYKIISALWTMHQENE